MTRPSRVFGVETALLVEGGADLAEIAAVESAAREASAGLPGRGTWWDAHVHLGRDADGHELDAASLLADMDDWGIGRSIIFPANDPGPDGQFAAANRQVTAAASRASARFVPFCRLDPLGDWEPSLDHWLAAGARGVKLHPVAQRFRPESDEAVALVDRAARLGLPVLIHAGYGARPLAGPIAALLDGAPTARLILAHGGRGDARALAAALAGHPRVRFDTSLAALPDLVTLPPEQLVFGTDRPYGDHGSGLHLVALAARIAGWSVAQLTAILGGTISAWVDA